MTTKHDQIKAMFGCSDEQLRAQSQKNADQLCRMAEKSERTGKKVNGYTAEELREMQRKAQECAEPK